MQRWGNHRANLYWEAHLKPGHMPPDQSVPLHRASLPPPPADPDPPTCSKIESFIRSKYELKRWAREGPVPEPESLDAEAAAAPAPAPVSLGSRGAHEPPSSLSRLTPIRLHRLKTLLPPPPARARTAPHRTAPRPSTSSAAAAPRRAKRPARPQSTPQAELPPPPYHPPPPQSRAKRPSLTSTLTLRPRLPSTPPVVSARLPRPARPLRHPQPQPLRHPQPPPRRSETRKPTSSPSSTPPRPRRPHSRTRTRPLRPRRGLTPRTRRSRSRGTSTERNLTREGHR